jgi:hypothetical protein
MSILQTATPVSIALIVTNHIRVASTARVTTKWQLQTAIVFRTAPARWHAENAKPGAL